jgi:hypothetical protein
MQMELGLIGCINEAGVVKHSEIVKINDYREAVRMCWIHRRVQRMTQETLAEKIEGMYASHVSDYLNVNEFTDSGRKRRSLPGEFIKEFQAICGNKFITQWMVWQEEMNLLQSLSAEQNPDCFQFPKFEQRLLQFSA